MNVNTNSADGFNAIKPTNVAMYLRSAGWKLATAEPGRYSVWVGTAPDTKPVEVLLVEVQEASDYARRMAELIEELVRFEDRAPSAIASDIHDVFFDVHRFRSPSSGSVPGSVYLEEGVALVNTARDLLIAAAGTIEGPRARISSRRPKHIDEALASALLGQTERGSYIVKAQLPVTPVLQAELFEDNLPPAPPTIERKIGIRLIEAASALRDAASEVAHTGRPEAIREAVHHGVSVEFCTAILDLHRRTKSGAVEVIATWSPARPLERGVKLDRSVRISSELMPPISAAVEVLRASSPIEEVVIRGYPLALRRPREAELFGMITLDALVPEIGPGTHQVLVKLGTQDYELAFDIQSRQGIARVSGNLAKRGNRWHLDSPSGFREVRDEYTT